jgi:hypothetical protein
MTVPQSNTSPPEETTEGNVTEIDLENRCILIEDRNGSPFMKLFWKLTQESFDNKPTVLFNQIRKLQKGYYVAPVIEGVDTSVSGKIKEAYLKSLPYKERPADFPRAQKKGGFGGSGGRPYTPKNEKPVCYESAFKSCVEMVRPDDFPGMDYAARVTAVMTQAELVGDWIVRKGGA